MLTRRIFASPGLESAVLDSVALPVLESANLDSLESAALSVLDPAARASSAVVNPVEPVERRRLRGSRSCCANDADADVDKDVDEDVDKDLVAKVKA